MVVEETAVTYMTNYSLTTLNLLLMPVEQNQSIGGLVLQKADVQEILANEKVVGIAFACKEKGVALNVDLDLLKVIYEDGQYIADVCPIPSERKYGTSSIYSYPGGPVDNFTFSHLEELEKCMYFFGYLPKTDFEALFQEREDWDEVFICGGIETFSPDTIEENNSDTWFNFTVAVRRGLKTKNTTGPNGHGSLIEVSSNGTKVTAYEISQAYPELKDTLQARAEAVLVEASSTTPQGVEFEDGTSLFFANDMQVQAAQINEDFEFLSVSVQEEGPNADESMSIGASLPFFRRAIGCPPQWPDSLTAPGPAEGDIRVAVERALSHSQA